MKGMVWLSAFKVLTVCTSCFLLFTACESGGTDERPSTVALTSQDSAATAREITASLSGDVAPRKQSYSFRGLYAGMTRARLEAHVRAGAAAPAPDCHPVEKPPQEISCSYTSILGADSARASVEAQFGAEDAQGERVARTITVSRELPLDVDGVRLARALSEAFAAQTALLDKREASYGHREAQVRMGTVNGAQQNFVDLSVGAHGGRELLTVKMSRR